MPNENNQLSSFEVFLAKVVKVYIKSEDFLDLKTADDYVKIYNKNQNFDTKDTRFLGAIEFARPSTKTLENYAFPFDKNNITYPISGETVLIIKSSDEYFWLPYTITQYPNFREDYKTTQAGAGVKVPDDSTPKSKDYKENKETGTPNVSNKKDESQKNLYEVKEKIKFLKPKPGDTILQGRVGNTIRFSEFFLTEDGKTSSPSIFIRNKQNKELDANPIGTLIDEDINKDGSSIYITSTKVKVPFKETITKEKIGFQKYPTSKDFSGDQIFINSDRILMSAKASEFIIFGKGNTGVITDGRFSIDSKDEIYMHGEKNITIHSKGSNNIFLNSDSGGNVYLGKNTGAGDDGSDVQHMVLGGELVKILGDLIDAITLQVYLTPCGPSKPGPLNEASFKSIKSKLKTLYSARNFLSKN